MTDVFRFERDEARKQMGANGLQDISNRMNGLEFSEYMSVHTKNKIDALNTLIAENDEVTRELNKCTIIKSALKNVIQKGIPGNSKLTEKLKLMVGADDAKALCQNMSLLGLEMQNFTLSLSAMEQNEIKPFLESEIRKVCQKILLYDAREAQQTAVKLIPAELAETKESMNYKLHKWNELLLKMKSAISELLDLQQEVRLLRKKESSWLSVTCEALELEAKTLAVKIQMQMYSENSYVVPAIKKASLSVEEEYNYTLEELEEFKKKKEAYDRLKGTEYDVVLEEYLQLKKEIDIKSWAISKLEGFFDIKKEF